jgi:hypothetical protein
MEFNEISSSLATLFLLWNLVKKAASHFPREAVTISKAIIKLSA